ncbi:hypothetical protein AB6E39_04735 [Vibrio splendidus]|uniref:hypothetical protein n=1 Tax=Vibrio TaxID=662 RepID=UPI0010BF4232|nr:MULTISPECIES: hypothetical protein [Vibrio]MCC4787417.1 hypothetical protein [Vibrio splendidus]TKF79632.1 hypothetical protein FCV62_07945 [Vibrio kanaloae]
MNERPKQLPFDEFDKTLPPLTTRIKLSPTRLVLNGKAIPLNNKHPDVRLLYRAIHNALLTEWWQKTLSPVTQRTYITQLSLFINWLNEHRKNNLNRFKLLNEFQVYRVNDGKVLPQSTGIKEVIVLLKEGAVSDIFTAKQQSYIHRLIENTNILEEAEPIPDTLTSWFTQMDWLRTIVGEKDWLAIESPKRLMASFSVTVASTLVWVLQIKSAISELVIKNPHINEVGAGLTPRQRELHYCRELQQLVVQHSKKLPEGSLELLLTDCANPKTYETCLNRLRDGKDLRTKTKVGNKYQNTFLKPHLFHPKYLATPSPLEQLLIAWLCAWQTVQPTDIRKLKSNNFNIHYNKNHRPIGLQCVYYKGRSGIQEPPFLNITLIEAKALITYLQILPSNNETICSDVRHVNYSPHSNHTLAGLLTRTWQISPLIKWIETHLYRRSASDLFRRLYVAVPHNTNNSRNAWIKEAEKKQQPFSPEFYYKEVTHPLPSMLFGLSAIKTSSVQARSDQYRDGDLINTNSHTVGVEKTSYMTDKNKEWVNLNGRVTRIVLDDIEHHVYKPNIDAAITLARERSIQTKVQKITGNQRVRINPLGQVIIPSADESFTGSEPGDLIVWDTPETVVYFLHYISEAERQSSRLIKHALQFFERTVLPDAEWMSALLNNRFSPDVIKLGKEQYQKLRGVLPPLFDAQIHVRGQI